MQISFILPIKNEVETITSAIEAIINQTIINHFNYEILISDGCSTDGTLEIINSFIQDNSNVHLIDNPQKIVSIGFNLALNKTKGDIIIRIDGHCEIPPDYLENCITLLENKNVDIVGGIIDTISPGIVGTAISIAQSSPFGVGGVKFRSVDLDEGSYVDTLAFGAHSREIFECIGGYDEEMICNQDDEFNHRVLQAGKKIWMDPSIKTKYFSRSTFSRLFKQYFNYGLYKIRGIQNRGGIVSIRHLIPSTFIVALIFTLIIGFFLQSPWISFSVGFLYLIFNLSASIFSTSSISVIPLISLAFWTLHLGYGLGFIWGLIRFINKWKDTELKDLNFNKEHFCSHNLK